MNILISMAIMIICAIIVVIVHEVPKSIVAHMLLHPIHKAKNKINTNVLKYVDPIGLIMFIFSGTGWQKPAEYKITYFRDKGKAVLSIALTGLLSNLVFMIVLIPLLRYKMNGYLLTFIIYLIKYNFSITIINLLPVPPFDMSKIIYFFSPNAYFRLIQNERLIHVIFLLLLAIDIIPMMVESLFGLFL